MCEQYDLDVLEQSLMDTEVYNIGKVGNIELLHALSTKDGSLDGSYCSRAEAATVKYNLKFNDAQYKHLVAESLPVAAAAPPPSSTGSAFSFLGRNAASAPAPPSSSATGASTAEPVKAWAGNDATKEMHRDTENTHLGEIAKLVGNVFVMCYRDSCLKHLREPNTFWPAGSVLQNYSYGSAGTVFPTAGGGVALTE